MNSRFRSRSTSTRNALRSGWLAVAIVVASCKQRETAIEAPAIGQAFVAAFGSDDEHAMREILAPDVQWDLEGLLESKGSGAEELIRTLERFRARIPDARLVETDCFVNGPRVLARGMFRGEDRFAGEIATRTYFELRIREGRIEALHWEDGPFILQEPPGEERFPPDWFLASLELAGPTRALTLDPYGDPEGPRQPDRDPVTGARLAFEGFAITGAAAIERPELRRQLSGLLYQGLYLGDVSAACFQPRHALEVDWNSEKLWIVICFECMGGYVEREDGSSRGFSISPHPEPAFSEIYRSLGLTVAPKID